MATAGLQNTIRRQAVGTLSGAPGIKVRYHVQGFTTHAFTGRLMCMLISVVCCSICMYRTLTVLLHRCRRDDSASEDEEAADLQRHPLLDSQRVQRALVRRAIYWTLFELAWHACLLWQVICQVASRAPVRQNSCWTSLSPWLLTHMNKHSLRGEGHQPACRGDPGHGTEAALSLERLVK